jgi:biotin transport system substrate-specific component
LAGTNTEGPATTARSRSHHLATAGLLVALLCASAWIAIPAGAVPVTLQVFVVLLTALLLPPVWAGSAVAVYLVLGAIGVPVFSAGQGGMGVIAGPTGGYLLGFLIGAVAGAVVRRSVRFAREGVADALAAAVALAVIYLVGTVRLAMVASLSLWGAVVVGVLPFIGIDVVKAIAAVAAAETIRRAISAPR